MIIGYMLVGAITGLLSSVIALLSGASFWLALGLYALGGSTAMILLPAILMMTIKGGPPSSGAPCHCDNTPAHVFGSSRALSA